MELTRSGKIAAALVLFTEAALILGFAVEKSKDCNDVAGAMIMSAVALSVVACASFRCACPSSFFLLNEREQLEERIISGVENPDSVVPYRAQSESAV